MAQYEKALGINPRAADLHYNLANALARQGRFDEAIAEFRQALDIKPDHAKARLYLGGALYQHGRMAEAVAQWRELIRFEPRDVPALNQLAWVLATSPDASVRNGPQALQLAQQAIQLSDGRDPLVLDTAAAAYAEAGRFPEACRRPERHWNWQYSRTMNRW